MEPRDWCSPIGFIRLCKQQDMGKACYIYSYPCASNDEKREVTEILLPESETVKACRIGVGLRRPVGPMEIVPSKDRAGSIQLSALDSAKIGNSDLFHGRILQPEKGDIELVKKWLHICEFQHAQKCEVPAAHPEIASPDPAPENLLVIDVQHMQLCYLPAGKRYVALSYCWPVNNTGNFTTSRADLPQLLQPGSLRERWESILPTVRDAIDVTRDIGDQYLWVDALCIVQDDDVGKQAQIRQMDLVYGAAFLTIICAPFDPGFSGLPCYRAGSRLDVQSAEEVQGLTLTTTMPNIDDIALSSRWDTRAWTFQEHRLSRRRLFFTELQLYFQCSCAVFCEDAVGEGIFPTAFIFGHTSLWNSCAVEAPYFQDGGQGTWISRSPAPGNQGGLWRYMDLLDQYSRRNLTFPGDIVFGFQGLMSLLTRVQGMTFLAGLPEQYFLQALLWLETGSHTRRKIEVSGSVVLPYPSWTWAGWATSITYLGSPLMPNHVVPEVDWFIVDDETGVIVRLDTPGLAAQPMQLSHGPDNQDVRPGQEEIPRKILESLRPREELKTSEGYWNPRQHLACWSSIASFKLTGDSFDMKGWGGSVPDHVNLVIFDGLARAVGSIPMANDWKEDELAEKARTYEFMLLSRSQEPRAASNGLKYFDSEKLSKRAWCFLNVMLVTRTGNTVTREGVGVIHEDAWVEAKPIPMFIKVY